MQRKSTRQRLVGASLAIALLFLFYSSAPLPSLVQPPSTPNRTTRHDSTITDPLLHPISPMVAVPQPLPPPATETPAETALPRKLLVISVVTRPQYIARALAVQATWARHAGKVSRSVDYLWTVEVRYVMGKGALQTLVNERRATIVKGTSQTGDSVVLEAKELPKGAMISDVPGGEGIDATGTTMVKLDGVVESDVEDMEGSLITRRVIWTLSWMHSTFPTADFYMKCDDDTFVVIENLVAYLSTPSPTSSTEKLYLGKLMSLPRTPTPLAFLSGGAGYILNRPALSHAVSHPMFPLSACSHRQGLVGEDIVVASCLEDVDILPKDVPGMYYSQPFNVLEVVGGGEGFKDERGPVVRPITWHWLQQGGKMGEVEWLVYGTEVWDGRTLVDEGTPVDETGT